MNQETIGFALLSFIVAGVFTLTNKMQKQQIHLRCLNLKLDALLKIQGVEWSSLSPEAQSLALEGRKIAALKIHREEHPGLGLAEAKADVETFAKKHEVPRRLIAVHGESPRSDNDKRLVTARSGPFPILFLMLILSKIRNLFHALRRF